MNVRLPLPFLAQLSRKGMYPCAKWWIQHVCKPKTDCLGESYKYHSCECIIFQKQAIPFEQVRRWSTEKPRRDLFVQVKFLQIRIVSQTVRNTFSFRKNISLCHQLTELIHIYDSTSTGHTKEYTLGLSQQRLHSPNIHLVNWKKVDIEMKLTSHMRSKAREAYWGSEINSDTVPSSIW